MVVFELWCQQVGFGQYVCDVVVVMVVVVGDYLVVVVVEVGVGVEWYMYVQ